MRAGTVHVVGLGPGSLDLMTPRATAVLAHCPVIAGYEGYIALAPPEALRGKRILATGMRGEMARCEAALDAAAAGQDVALVCSGDPGVYAMAGLVLELSQTSERARAVDIQVVPGVPALAAAAALLGAPLNHDFACVSLSDLLTPWERIQTRICAALEADFVLVLYNPRSRRRTAHLEWTLNQARRRRGEEGAAGIVRLAERDGQSVWAGPLREADATRVDMFSLVILGNSATRLSGNRMITPRGYLEKYGAPAHGPDARG